MRRAADHEREVIRKALPDSLVSDMMSRAYSDLRADQAEIAARIHLTTLVEDGLIERDGSVTEHGRQTMRDLTAIESWHRKTWKDRVR